LDRANQELQYLTLENNGKEDKIQSLIDEKLKVDEEILTLKDLLSAKKSEYDREIRAKEKFESALKQANEAINRKESENAIKLQEIKSIREQMSRIEGTSREDRIKAEKLEQEKDHIDSKVLRLHQDYEEQTQTILRLMKENNQYVVDLTAWEEEVAKQKDEFKLISRARDSLNKRLKVIDDAKNNAEVERDSLKVRIVI
jgi:chromosome segregation ATPase